MSDSPFRNIGGSSQLFLTPSRKTTPHHCNADRKVMPACNVQQADLSSLSRNLFGQENYSRQSNAYQHVDAKLFR